MPNNKIKFVVLMKRIDVCRKINTVHETNNFNKIKGNIKEC